jgi:hypothetical protein
MAIAYPNYQADPNSVPKINGLPGIIDGIQKGYMLAQLPEKLRNEREQTRLSTERAQMENQYYPQKTRADINEANARAYLLQQQGKDLDPSALTDFLNRRNTQSGMMPPPAQSGQPSMGAPPPISMNQQPVSVPMRPPTPQAQAPQQAIAQPTQQSAPGQSTGYYQNGTAPQPNGYYQNSGGGQSYLISGGNPDLYAYDDAYENDPGARRYLERHGYAKSVSTQIDEKGRLVSLTKYPSGKQEATILETGGGTAGNAFQEQEGKDRAKIYGEYSNRATGASKLNTEFKSLDELMASDSFDSAVGPVDSYMNKKGLATKATQDAYGQAAGITGRIHTQLIGSMPGNAQAAKINLVNSIKPNVTDPENVFRGKAKALKIAQEYEEDFYKKISRLMKSGMSEVDALEQTEKEVVWDNYKNRIVKAASGKEGEYYKPKTTNKTFSDDEVHAATDHLSVEELQRALSGGQ